MQRRRGRWFRRKRLRRRGHGRRRRRCGRTGSDRRSDGSDSDDGRRVGRAAVLLGTALDVAEVWYADRRAARRDRRRRRRLRTATNRHYRDSIST